MATKEQYEAFKILFFDQEEKRSTSLIGRGKIFISLATLYGAFITFTIEKIHNNTILSWSLFACAVASMLVSFLLSILAMGIYQYEDINRPEAIIKNLGGAPKITKQMFEAGQLLGITMLDHIVFTSTGYFSFRENREGVLK